MMIKLIDDTKKNKKKFSISRLSKTGKRVESTPEEQIADYLDRHNIPYKKPNSAFRGQYYMNYKFKPDFLIGNVAIEYFGIRRDKNYNNKIELKKKNRYPNREYIFLDNINKIGSLCTRFKHLIGKNPQIRLDKSFENIIKEDEKYKLLLQQYYNEEIGNKIMILFNKEYAKKLKEIRHKIFDEFMQRKGKKYLHKLLLLEKEKNSKG